MKKYLLAIFWVLLLAGTGWAIPPMPGGTGTGDMAKATYDADGDNLVDGDKVESPTPQTAACTGAALDLQPTVKLLWNTIVVTATEACAVTMKEASNQTGQIVTIINGSAAGVGPLTFADQAGVLELKYGSPFVLERHHSITLFYKTDRWVELGRLPLYGTPGTYFQIDNGNSGPRLNHNAGVLEILNSGGTDYLPMKVLSLTVKKTTGTAGQMCAYDDYDTEEYGDCWEGSHQTGALGANRIYQFPTAAPSGGQVMLFPTPTAGRSTPTWLTPMASTGAGLVERIGATFDGGGSAIALNKIAYVHVPFAVTTINQWTVVCDQDSGANGIIITPYMDAYAEDTLPTTTMCTTGTAPHTSGGATAGGTAHQAAWDCDVTAIPADRVVSFKVTQAPSSATWCTVSLKVTR